MFHGCMNGQPPKEEKSLMQKLPPYVRYPLQIILVLAVLWFFFAPKEETIRLAVIETQEKSQAYDGVFSSNPKTYQRPETTKALAAYVQKKAGLESLSEAQYQVEYHDLDKDTATQEVFFWLAQDGPSICQNLAQESKALHACRMYVFQIPQRYEEQVPPVKTWAVMEKVTRPIKIHQEGKGLPVLESTDAQGNLKTWRFDGAGYL